MNFGFGLIRGLIVTMGHFIGTFWEDLKWIGRRYYTAEGIAHRSSKAAAGIFTVQYPEEKLPVPEEFRFIPFLLYEEGPEGEQLDRCTSCGICAKVCPPQCIWIVRTEDPDTGRPVPEPVDFYIDIDICMNCGYCAEYCPFDAIKMDHNYELASYDRHAAHIYNKQKLSMSVDYYAEIRPRNFKHEEDIRIAKEEEKAAKAAARAVQQDQ